MVTGKHPSRIRFAKVAARCFLEQTHSEKELIIINDSSFPVGCSHSQVREIMVPYSLDTTLGDLRNAGILHARGELVLQWDDDDWHDPRRMELQASFWERGSVVLLKQQIRYSFPHNTAYLHKTPKGIVGTILHERNCKVRYPSVRCGEDLVFLRQFRYHKVFQYGSPLYIRFYHGENTLDANYIMGRFAQERNRDRWRLPAQAQCFLRFILDEYYAEVK